MALVTRNATDIARSLDVNQFVQFLTGLMPDQRATLASLIRNFGDLQLYPVASPAITSATLTGTGGGPGGYFSIVAVNGEGVQAIPGATTFVASAQFPLSGQGSLAITFNPVQGAATYRLLYNTSTNLNAARVVAQIVNAVPGSTAPLTFTYTNDPGAAFTPATSNPGGNFLASDVHSTGQVRSDGLVVAGGAQVPTVGALSGALAGAGYSYGGQQIAVQFGTTVVRTNAGGGTGIDLPYAFPNGLITAMVNNSDGGGTPGIAVINASLCNNGHIDCRLSYTYGNDGGGPNWFVNALVRLNWVAFGW